MTITENPVHDVSPRLVYQRHMGDKFKLAVNLTWKDKLRDVYGNWKVYGNEVPDWLHGRPVNPARAWSNIELTLDELAEHVHSGHSIAPQLNSYDGQFRDSYETFGDIWNQGGYRNENNFVRTNWVAIDIDEGYESIEQIANHDYFKRYGSLLYTSASHTPEHPKARLVFQLENTLDDAHDVRALQTSLIRKFGGDRQCNDAARQFFGAEGCEIQKFPDQVLPDSEIQKLIRLGALHLGSAHQYGGGGLTAAHAVNGKHLPPDTLFTLGDGTVIRFSDISSKYIQCFCPLPQHGPDKRPGAFLSKNESGHYFVCKKCDEKAWWMEQAAEDDDPIDKLLRGKSAQKKTYKERMIEKFRNEKEQQDDPLQYCKAPGDLLDFGNEYQPYSRQKRAEMLRKQYRATEKRMLLYAAEGFGKSYLAYLLTAEHQKKVVFACKSNAQAEEQYESFKKLGVNAQLICSREHWLRTVEKVAVEVYDPKHPWDYQELNETRTKQNMRQSGMSDERIEELWEQYKDPDPDFGEFDMIITTQARVSGWGRVQMWRQVPVVNEKGETVGRTVPKDRRVVPDGAVIFCDDAQLEDFCMLADFNNDYVSSKYFEFLGEEGEVDPKVDGKYLERKEIGDYVYFVRPNSYLFGYGFSDNQIIFSTTEQVTREMIFRRYGGRKEKNAESGKTTTIGRVYEPTLIPEYDQKMNAGTITVVKTQFVQKRLDGILPVVAERVRAIWENQVGYVADGQGCETNHVTIKGQNAFSDHDMIIEISFEHMSKIRKLLHELEWEYDSAEFLKVMLACDTIHQAIGRNSGYRYSDRSKEERRESVVLIEPRLFHKVMQYLRYKVSATVDLDHPAARLKRDQIGKHFPTTVAWFVKHPVAYMEIQGGRTFLADVKRALKDVGTRSTHPLVRQTRLLESLQTIKNDIARRDQVRHVDLIINRVQEIDTVNRPAAKPREAVAQ